MSAVAYKPQPGEEPFNFETGEPPADSNTNGVNGNGVSPLGDGPFKEPEDGKKKKAKTLKRTTPHDVFERWKISGPLVHEATGLAVLDERTGGGLVYGSRVYILGAPDSGKTALCAQLAHDWALRGVVVGVLAVDEEDDDLLTRLVQRLVVPQPDPVDCTDVDASEPRLRDKFTRQDCEHRDPRVVGEMERTLGDLPLAFYGPDWTIEGAAADLVAFAKSLTKEGEPPRHVVLFVDSIQAVTSAATEAAGKEPSIREMVNANVKAVRAVASKYKMLVVATGEMNREAYKGIEAGESGDIASGKETGAIEYSARVLVSLRNVKDKPDLVLVRLAKNKQGPAWRGKEDDFYLSLNRATQTFTDAMARDATPTKGTLCTDPVLP